MQTPEYNLKLQKETWLVYPREYKEIAGNWATTEKIKARNEMQIARHKQRHVQSSLSMQGMRDNGMLAFQIAF